MNKQIITEIIINSSKEKVWQVLTDFSSYHVWNPFIISIEGELKKGSKLKNTLRNGDKTIR
ncbi:MAG TPA: SRPBCC family protein, partial [Chitinophagaceae bacterium]|nr:SRPBCC family protein [Chitinophagaceae bacterium]